MDLRQRLEAVLRRPKESPEDAERAARAAEALAALMRATEMAERALAPDLRRPVSPRTGDLARLTLHDAAAVVLEEAGAPLHVRELGKRIKARGWVHKRSANPSSDQIEYQLAARLPRHPDRFKRVAPNTFALAEWSDAARPNVQPRFGLFRGPGGRIAAQIGESPDEPLKAAAWRSS